VCPFNGFCRSLVETYREVRALQKNLSFLAYVSRSIDIGSNSLPSAVNFKQEMNSGADRDKCMFLPQLYGAT
jgi:hypothetical protein